MPGVDLLGLLWHETNINCKRAAATLKTTGVKQMETGFSESKPPDRQKADLQEKCDRNRKTARVGVRYELELSALCSGCVMNTKLCWMRSTAVKCSSNQVLGSQSTLRPSTDMMCCVVLQQERGSVLMKSLSNH